MEAENSPSSPALPTGGGIPIRPATDLRLLRYADIPVQRKALVGIVRSQMASYRCIGHCDRRQVAKPSRWRSPHRSTPESFVRVGDQPERGGRASGATASYRHRDRSRPPQGAEMFPSRRSMRIVARDPEAARRSARNGRARIGCPSKCCSSLRYAGAGASPPTQRHRGRAARRRAGAVDRFAHLQAGSPVDSARPPSPSDLPLRRLGRAHQYSIAFRQPGRGRRK
jgi:hypothetical protein